MPPCLPVHSQRPLCNCCHRPGSLLTGGLYALSARGLSLTFGVMKVINPAHPDTPARQRALPAGGLLSREDPAPVDAYLLVESKEDTVAIFGSHKTRMITPEDALPGRSTPLPVPARHEVLGTPLQPPYPEGMQVAEFALGCFWGEERTYWQTPGVFSTSVGYEGGYTPNPSYEEVCSGRTGHAETVRVVFDPAKVSYRDLLKVFWESHDPTQGMRQGNDVGSQYRSVIFYSSDEQRAAAQQSRTAYQHKLTEAGYGEISTEIVPAGEFYFAEAYHQQYLADTKNPHGYCPANGTGVSCPVGVIPADG